MRRQISEPVSGVFLGVLVVLGLALIGMLAYFAIQLISARNFGEYGPLDAMVPVVIVLVVTRIGRRVNTMARSRVVWLDENGIYVQGESGEVYIPLGNIEAVEQGVLPKAYEIKLRFRHQTEVGSKLVIYTREDRMRRPFSSPAVADEINAMLRAQN